MANFEPEAHGHNARTTDKCGLKQDDDTAGLIVMSEYELSGLCGSLTSIERSASAHESATGSPLTPKEDPVWTRFRQNFAVNCRPNASVDVSGMT